MDASTTCDIAADITCSTASVKLPPFARTEAQIWFRRAEIQFRLKGITRSTTKADYVLAALPEDVFPLIAHWLSDQPDELTYETLKEYLLKEFTLKIAARAQRVLALASQPLGDQSASQAWSEIQALLTLPVTSAGSGGKLTKVDLEREIWLQRLPEGIRAALPDAELMPMTDLVNRADALIAANKAVVRPQRPMVGELQDDDMVAEVNQRGWRGNGHQERGNGHQERGNGYQRKRSGYLTRSGVCNYHWKWGESARACVAGCKWQKNGLSGR